MKNKLLYAGIGKEEYNRIKNEIFEDNLRELRLCSFVSTIFMTALFVLSLFTEVFRVGKWLYLSVLVVDIAVFLIARYGKLSDAALKVFIYLFWSLFLVMGMILSFVVAPDKNAVTFIVFLLIGPLLFTDRPIKIGVFVEFFAFVYVIAAFFLKDPSVMIVDVLHVAFFSVIGVLISYYTIRLRLQKYLFANEAKRLINTDLLTGVQNRNSFEINKNGYLEKSKKNICCVYLDANGLHELNNSRGHKAGDEMLKRIASELKNRFGEKDVYRMGGDEFVALVADQDPTETEKKVESLKRFSEDNDGVFSIGCAVQSRDEINPDKLLEEAEGEMYRAKDDYYKQRGKGLKRV